ncbi:MAG TPA: c-type cytochrome [Polyangiaceae bacterium]|jgi:cytochrome c oxidase cbb3-type subunit 3/ubiquinol-cytochrome c reductase cytochrome c subunit|nr:c-type cytochrome [Polyangiaceae bacterium]
MKRFMTPARSALLATLAVAVVLGACNRGRSSPSGAASASAQASHGALAAPSAHPALPSLPSAAPELPASTERGRELYGRMCAVCHGANGEGYRADGAPTLSQPAYLASVSDDFLDFAIAIGRPRTTMAAWRTDQGGPLSAWDIKSVIAFLRTWQGPPVKLDEGYVHGDAVRGKALFVKECESCHGAKAKNVHILSRQWLTFAKTPFIRYAIANGRPSTPMKAFSASLGADRIEEILGYMRSLPAWLAPGEVAGSIRPPPIPLGPVPLNPKGPAPVGFRPYPAMTPLSVIWRELQRHARIGILDARTSSDYTTLHIEGAVSVPFYDPSPYLDDLPRREWLVCYCGCPHSESGALAQQLLNAGFTKVTVLDEGFGAWTAAGHPTRNGQTP